MGRRVYENSVYPVYGPRGTVNRVAIFARDITEKLALEKELRETKDYLENIVQSSVDAIVTTDPKGRITFINRAMEEMVGLSRDKIIGLPISDPRVLEELGKREGNIGAWHITTNPEDHIKMIEEHIKLGFNRIQLHSSSPDEAKFIARYGKEVLPYLKEKYGQGGK
jgi:PAS domain S-box-containing protein